MNQEDRKSTRFLKRYVIPSDSHEFIGRIFDLSVVRMYFGTYEEFLPYPHARYVVDVNFWLTTMVQRIESLNRVADMLWLEPGFISEPDLPITRYDWLNIAADAFLMRIISVADGAMILTSEVFELGLEPEECSVKILKRKGVSKPVVQAIKRIVDNHLILRKERNSRFHHGIERSLTSDDQTFRSVEMIGKYYEGSIKGKDFHDRQINVRRYMREGLVELQKSFNPASRKLSKDLDKLYDLLFAEFERRFKPKYRDPETGFDAMIAREWQKINEGPIDKWHLNCIELVRKK